jgi:hypothetical protein
MFIFFNSIYPVNKTLHATQMLTSSIWLYCVLKISAHPPDNKKKNNNNADVLAWFLSISTILWIVVAPKLHFEHNLFFELTFALITLICVVRLVYLSHFVALDKRAKTSVNMYVSWMLLGIALWLLDLHACNALQSTGLYLLKFGNNNNINNHHNHNL